jgi:hypothetical protein
VCLRVLVGLLVGALVTVLVGLYIYALSPRYWDERDGDETPGPFRAIWVVSDVWLAILLIFALGIGLYALATGNSAGRVVGAVLVLAIGIALYRLIRNLGR